MNYDSIKAHLNLYAILQNLEELVKLDQEMALLVKNWNVTIRFNIWKCTQCYLVFKNGQCLLQTGKPNKSSIHLFFTSPKHLNNMFAGTAKPILLKGLSKLSFLTKEFPKLMERLVYYLKPSDELLKDPHYLMVNTWFSLHTAMYAAQNLAQMDHISMQNAARFKNGALMAKVLPDGPCVQFVVADKKFSVIKGETAKPDMLLLFKDIKTASDVIHKKTDFYAAIASGAVMIQGEVLTLELLDTIQDRIPVYLQ